jgi:hypothetical protein
MSEIYHHGIKGMKWGVRRNEEELARARGHIANQSKLGRSSAKLKRTIEMDDPSKMTDEELRQKVNRMNLERQYRDLSTSHINRGESITLATLDVAGDVLAVAGSAVAIAVSLQALKKGR